MASCSMKMRALRLVLMPYGPPRSELMGPCLDAVRRCGGDLNRIIDAPAKSLASFARYVGRMKAIVVGGPSPLVVLTRTNPLALAVTGARRMLESAVPALEGAAWIVFYDRKDDPFFEAEAEAVGILEPRSDRTLMWTSPYGQPFLIVSKGEYSGLDVQIDELLSMPPIGATQPAMRREPV
jgi:hypothetical protein